MCLFFFSFLLLGELLHSQSCTAEVYRGPLRWSSPLLHSSNLYVSFVGIKARESYLVFEAEYCVILYFSDADNSPLLYICFCHKWFTGQHKMARSAWYDSTVTKSATTPTSTMYTSCKLTERTRESRHIYSVHTENFQSSIRSCALSSLWLEYTGKEELWEIFCQLYRMFILLANGLKKLCNTHKWVHLINPDFKKLFCLKWYKKIENMCLPLIDSVWR